MQNTGNKVRFHHFKPCHPDSGGTIKYIKKERNRATGPMCCNRTSCELAARLFLAKVFGVERKEEGNQIDYRALGNPANYLRRLILFKDGWELRILLEWQAGWQASRLGTCRFLREGTTGGK